MNISLIIPVYKVEKYIKECLDSVVNQINNDMEVIIIDDGSPDNSGIICDDYAEKYERIKVIHKKNEGVSVARNIGIDEAKGKYIMFLDSDDILSDNIIDAIKDIIKEEADIYSFTFDRIDDDSNVIFEKKKLISNGIYTREKFFDNYYKKLKEFPWNIWQNLYCANIIKNNNIRFPVGKRAAEDIDFYLKYAKCVKKVKFFNKPMIKYRTSRIGSATTDLKLKAMLDIFDTCNKHFYGEDEFISKHVANLYVAFLNMIIRLKNNVDREKVINMIDSNIVKKASRPKYIIFKIIYFILGKRNTMRLFLRMQEKRRE